MPPASSPWPATSYGGVGISVGTALVTDHLQIRQAHLVKYLDGTNQPYNDLLQQIQGAAMSYGSSMAEAARNAPGQVFQILQQQTSTLAYEDVFFIVGIMSLSITFAAIFMSNVTPRRRRGRRMKRIASCAPRGPRRPAAPSAPPTRRPPRLPKKSWQNAQQSDSTTLTTDPDPRWWADFHDPTLTDLMQTAIRDNLDVQQAILRVVESRQGIVTAAAAGPAASQRHRQLHARTARRQGHPGIPGRLRWPQ